MKRIIFLAIVAIALLGNQAQAGHQSPVPILVGGGAGAVIGQAIGHSPESTIIGATIGGLIGAIAVTEHGHSPVVHHVYHSPPRPHRPQWCPPNHHHRPPHHYYRQHHHDRHPKHYQPHYERTRQGHHHDRHDRGPRNRHHRF